MIDQSFLINSLISLFVFLLLGSFFTLFSISMARIGKYLVKEEIFTKKRLVFFFQPLTKKFFNQNELDYIQFATSFIRHIFYLLYAICALLFLDILFSFHKLHSFAITIVVVVLFIFFDITMRILATIYPKNCLRASIGICSIFNTIFFVITAPIYKLICFFFKKSKKDLESKRGRYVHGKILEILHDAGISSYLSSFDKKIIASFITYKEKVAREIMIPRVDILGLSAESTIKEAGEFFLEEDYSRIPVYRDSLDNIIGIILFKDILKTYIKNENNPKFLQTTIDTIAKPVIYAPENKKISLLFQEFRNKQTHIAIIVNEYGGTEGIVTIEDVLEELVGEIEDEYDVDEEKQFWKLPNGSWVVDAKMSIVDMESKLGIHIPHNPEYETIGGYIFHRAGTIPSKGWILHHDDFELEVLISNERCLEKIRISVSKNENN
jgi:putative hemolysin